MVEGRRRVVGLGKGRTVDSILCRIYFVNRVIFFLRDGFILENV